MEPDVLGLCRERADKEAFYEGQGSTGGAFMRMALTTLALLNKLSAHPVIKQSLLQPPLVGSAAFNCLHFLELLVSFQLHCVMTPKAIPSAIEGIACLADHAAHIRNNSQLCFSLCLSPFSAEVSDARDEHVGFTKESMFTAKATELLYSGKTFRFSFNKRAVLYLLTGCPGVVGNMLFLLMSGCFHYMPCMHVGNSSGNPL